MNKAILLTGIFSLAMSFAAVADDRTLEFDEKHKACLEQIAEDAEVAYEDAMIWRGDGGGRRARHCEAMALFALGHKQEAAHRLDLLGGMVGQLSPQMRKNYYLEAANFWLMSEETMKAYESSTAGLTIDTEDVGLRIARARVYALLNRYKDAETDLSSALAYEPNHTDALRYRADARYKLGKLDAAKIDIDKAMLAGPTVESALVRGHIIEALRVRKVAEDIAGPVDQTTAPAAPVLQDAPTLTGHEFLSVPPTDGAVTVDDGSLSDAQRDLMVPDFSKEDE